MRNAFQTFPIPVAFDRICQIERRRISEHVFNLHTLAEQYTAEGKIVHNCRPPRDWLSGAPWEAAAIRSCDQHRQPVLEEGHLVHVALGAQPAKWLLGNPPKYSVRSFHGCPFRSRHGWVVPTFHPSFLLQGGSQFTNVMMFDISRAFEIADAGGVWEPEPYEAVVDPSPAWFAQWIDQFVGDSWLVCDIETPYKLKAADKEEDEDDEGRVDKDPTYDILRISFSCHPDQGVSVPWQEPFISLAKRALAKQVGMVWFWNWRYDVPRLAAAGCPITAPIHDGMDAWGELQARLPRRLAFVAPFYSKIGPWKHLASTNPGLYSALDAVQEARCIWGIARDLQREGRWDTYIRHRHMLDRMVLVPAETEGLLASKPALEQMQQTLEAKQAELKASFSSMTSIGKLLMSKKEKPGYKLEVVELEVQWCAACLTDEVSKKHRCKAWLCGNCRQHWQKKPTKKTVCCDSPAREQLQPAVQLGPRQVQRWVLRQPFNPDSQKEMLAYFDEIGEAPGKNKKSGNPSVGKQVVEQVIRKSKDPLLTAAMRHKAVTKVKSTYVDGSLKRLGKDSRLHPTFTHGPYTDRLSCVDPNLQNIDSREAEDGEDAADRPEAGFKKVIRADPDCVLVEADFSGIEAVLSGYFMGDPDYMRLAILGIHDYVTSHLIGKPASLKWSDEQLSSYFASVTKKHPKRHVCKKTVHRTNYVSSAWGMHRDNPEIFPSVKAAQELQNLYLTACPKLQPWWHSLWKQAHKQNYLQNPFGHKVYFWDVYAWDSRKKQSVPSKDAKKAVAFMPQSTAAGILYQACLELTDPDSPTYIGDVYRGRTPIRALIHDSILAEVPREKLDLYLERVRTAMTRPIPQLPCPPEWGRGSHLSIGVDIKVGESWGEMEKLS